jgi:hypothetical protein
MAPDLRGGARVAVHQPDNVRTRGDDKSVATLQTSMCVSVRSGASN